MTSRVRQASPADLPTLNEIYTRLYPQQPAQFDFSAHDYLLAFFGDTPAGYLAVSRSNRKGDPPGKVWAYLTLDHPEEEAVMRALYGRLEALPGVHSIFTMTHESRPERQLTLTTLGYHERLRSYGADLEVSRVDPSTFGEPEIKLKGEGVHIYTLADLMSDPNYAKKLYALYLESNRDVPEVGHSDTLDAPAFSEHLQREDALPEAYYIAVHEGRYVGYSELFRRSATELAQETTAVLSAYRRRGIALALKLRGIDYAQRHGFTRINTGMASSNRAMVSLNTRLGFRPQAAYITFGKEFYQNLGPRH